MAATKKVAPPNPVFSNLLPAIENAYNSTKTAVNNSPITNDVLQIMRGIPQGIAQTGVNIARRAYAGQGPVEAIGGEAIDQGKAMVNQLGNVSKDLGAGLAMNSQPGVQQSQNEAMKGAQRAYDKAQKTKDPAEKARLLKVANDAYKMVSGNNKNIAGEFSPDVNQSPLIRGVQTGSNVAAIAGVASPLVEKSMTAYSNSPLADETGAINFKAKVGKGELPPIDPAEQAKNTWSEYIKNPKTGNLVKNPNFKAGSGAPTTYSQEAPEYPTTETNPEAAQPRSTEIDTSQWPQISEELPPITSKKPFKLPGQYDPIENTSAPNAARSSKAYSDTTPKIQDAYRRNSITDPNQVYQVKQSLYEKTINPALETSKTKLPIGSITDKVDGIYPKIVDEMMKMDPSMDSQTAADAAQRIVNRIGDIARREGDPMANGISLNGALKYKTMLNDSTAVQNYFENIRPTNPNDIATVASRNVLQSSLEKYAPSGITQAVKDYGLLEEGFPSYLKAFNTQPAPFSLTDSLAGKDLGKFVPPIIKAPIDITTRAGLKLAGNPVGKLALAGGVGSLATIGGIALHNELAKNDKGYAGSQKTLTGTQDTGNITPDATKVKSVPQNPDEITFDKKGHVGVFNPFDGINGITRDQYMSSIADLNKQQLEIDNYIKDHPVAMQTPAAYTIKAKEDAIKTQRDTLDNLNEKSRSLDEPYGKALNTSSMGNKATDDIKNGWSNISLANGDLNKLATINNGKYSKLASALKALEDQTQIPIFEPGMSLDVILGNLQQAIQTDMYNKYYSKFKSQGGYNQTNSVSTNSGIDNTIPGAPPITSSPINNQPASQAIPNAPTGWASGGPTSWSQ